MKTHRLCIRPLGLAWSGVDGFVQEMWRPLSFMEKLLSGKRDQGDRELGVSLGGLAFVASQGVPGMELIVGTQYS